MSRSGTPDVHPSATVERSTLGPWTLLARDVTLRRSELGAYSYVMERSQVDHTWLGKFCSVASDVRLNPGQHPLERPSSHHFTYRSAAYGLGDDDHGFFEGRARRTLTVGHDVWIGHGATVMGGLSVGDGASIGAGAVVTRDVPAYTVVAGVPARVVRARFPPGVAERLARVRWWDWTHEQLRERLTDLRGDVQSFLAHADPEVTP